MINELVVHGTHDAAVDLTRRLELLFNEHASDMRELLAAGISAHRVANLYPFSLESCRAAISAMVASPTFTHPMLLAVKDLHPGDLEADVPEEVDCKVVAELKLTDPYKESFAASTLMVLSTYMHHLAAFDISDLLVSSSANTYGFVNPDWAVNAQWELLLIKLSRINDVVNELEKQPRLTQIARATP